MKIETGIIKKPLKGVIYGPEGVGKTTFASKLPNPLFLDVEGGTGQIDCKRATIKSWLELEDALNTIEKDRDICDSLIIDTADWAEFICTDYCLSRDKKTSIESYGYGKGYKIIAEEFKKLLDKLDKVREVTGIHTFFTAHSIIKKFELPDESGSYDRWELKLTKHIAPLVKEWADLILFANFKTIVISDESGKAKARGGQQRIMYACHHACWDAKNRHSLPDEMPFEFDQIEKLFDLEKPPKGISAEDEKPKSKQEAFDEVNKALNGLVGQTLVVPAGQPTAAEPGSPEETVIKFRSMMAQKGVDEDEVREAVARAGIYQLDVPVERWSQEFIEKKLLVPEQWDKFCNKFNIIEIPF